MGKGGEFGEIMISPDDLKKGVLKVTSPKVIGLGFSDLINKKIDKDTVDLLTKRFNKKRNYSDLSKDSLRLLTRLGGLPEHKTSGKFNLLRDGYSENGVVFFQKTTFWH